MNTEIIAVGNEVVFGHTINTNAAFIAQEIEQIGVTVQRHHAVCDRKEDIANVLEESLRRSKLIFLIGGLGPTKDDLTKEIVCETLGIPLIQYQEIICTIKEKFIKMGKTMPESNIKQALFPKECVILENNHGTAPGCIIAYKEAKIILLPGPPRELKPMIKQVIDKLREMSTKQIYTTDIQLFGIGESHVAEKLNHLLEEREDIIVAPYVGNNEVIIRIKAMKSSLIEAEQEVSKYVKEVQKCLGAYIIGYNGSKLEEVIVAHLKQQKYTLATAESCTGGMVASTLINCSGVSDILSESVITYSNDAKKKYLGVTEESLMKFGAVSKEVALEMAKGIQKKANATIGMATTGIAGPEGGTQEKPIGLVYIAIAIGDKTHVHELRLQGTRQEIREKTTKNLLWELYKLVNKIYLQ